MGTSNLLHLYYTSGSTDKWREKLYFCIENFELEVCMAESVPGPSGSSMASSSERFDANQVLSMLSDFELSSSSDEDMVLDLSDPETTTVHTTVGHLDDEMTQGTPDNASSDEVAPTSPFDVPAYDSSDDEMLQSPFCSRQLF